MVDRLPSDHPSVESVRSRVARHGGARKRIEVPAEILPDEDVIRVVINEETYFGSLHAGPSATERWITGVYESPRLARDPGDAEDYLEAWLDRHDRSPGSSVLVDVIEPEYAIGLRPPGERTVYEAVESPSDSLDAIARSLEEDP